VNIKQANIDRFNLQLETETGPTKRAMIVRLLAEQRQQLKSLMKPQVTEAQPTTEEGD
jgi:hypothetical protein